MSNSHDDLVTRMVRYYENNGYSNVKADHIQSPNGIPDLVNGFRPDISADKNNSTIICEVETAESLLQSHTVEQWQAFSRSYYEFHICVLQSCYNDAVSLARRYNVKVNSWWTVKD